MKNIAKILFDFFLVSFIAFNIYMSKSLYPNDAQLEQIAGYGRATTNRVYIRDGLSITSVTLILLIAYTFRIKSFILGVVLYDDGDNKLAVYLTLFLVLLLGIGCIMSGVLELGISNP